MQSSAEETLSDLLDNSSDENEIHINVGEKVLRLNLKPEDIMLWKDTLNKISNPGNVLLACESNQKELSTLK